jgi:hypothetical protein
MNASNENTAPKRGLRGWWASPPRSGMRLLIHPWAYRHLGVLGVMHLVGGILAAAAGIVCLSHGAGGWGGLFLLAALASLMLGGWYLTIARSASA